MSRYFNQVFYRADIPARRFVSNEGACPKQKISRVRVVLTRWKSQVRTPRRQGPLFSGRRQVIIMTVIFALPFIFLPWIPGLRDIPRLIPLYKVIYRRHYARPHDPVITDVVTETVPTASTEDERHPDPVG